MRCWGFLPRRALKAGQGSEGQAGLFRCRHVQWDRSHWCQRLGVPMVSVGVGGRTHGLGKSESSETSRTPWQCSCLHSFVAHDPTRGRRWAALSRAVGASRGRGLDGSGGSPSRGLRFPRPKRSRRLPKPLGSGSRRLPSALRRSAGPAGQGSAPQRPLSAALRERRSSPKSGGCGGGRCPRARGRAAGAR